MSIPGFQAFLLPVLKAVSNTDILSSKEARRNVIETFGFSEEDQGEMLPSGTQTVIANRVAWSLVYLQKASLLKRVSRGKYSITSRGKEVLQQDLDHIDIKFLQQFDEFRTFQGKETINKEYPTLPDSDADPLELLEISYKRLKDSTLDDLLEQVSNMDPYEFEKLVLSLLKEMGYGTSDQSSFVHRGSPGDGGIDGEISEDPLGLEMIYLQAKRYNGNSVGRPAIQQFVGSLNERRARKGVFLTTSSFTKEAQQYVDRVDVKIILIDGKQLVRLMYDYGIGVTTDQVYKLKSVDADFFE